MRGQSAREVRECVCHRDRKEQPTYVPRDRMFLFDYIKKENLHIHCQRQPGQFACRLDSSLQASQLAHIENQHQIAGHNNRRQCLRRRTHQSRCYHSDRWVTARESCRQRVIQDCLITYCISRFGVLMSIAVMVA